MEAVAKLNNVPTSPRKMRLVADVIRGERVGYAMNVLKVEPKHCSVALEKLLRSAIANWEAKNEGARIEDADLYVKSVFVDSGRMLKRIQPAPQGRAHRIRKRSNHITMVVDSLNPVDAPEKPAKKEAKKKEEVKKEAAPKAKKETTKAKTEKKAESKPKAEAKTKSASKPKSTAKTAEKKETKKTDKK